MSRPLRYTFILVVVALGTGLAAVSGWRYARASAPVSGPIVLISVDALRADYLPAYGGRQLSTPGIDRLAADGVIFERAYAHVPQTFPAHAAMLTGRLPFETGVRDGTGPPLAGSERLLPEMLGDRGYATAGIVSSFLLRKESGIDRGFSLFDDDLPAADDDGPALTRPGADSEKIAERWLDSIGTPRAFLFLHLAEPHGPRRLETQHAEAAAGAPTAYDASIETADAAIDRLVRYLKAHQLYDQSTIILVADHGEGLGDHGELGHGLLVYEEALRVPLIIKPPAGAGAGRRVTSLVQHIDLVPTILDLANAPVPGNLRGRSLTPLFSKNDPRFDDRVVYSESQFGRTHFGWTPLTSFIVGRYQLLLSGENEQLFDLDSAPDERYDLSAERTDVAADLRKELSAYVSDVSPSLRPSPVTESDRERFEALGYVGVPGTDALPDLNGVDSLSRVAFIERYRQAVRESRANDWKGALESYRALTREEPGMADLWVHFGRAAARNESHDLAVDAYRHSLALSPTMTTGRLGLAASFLRLRKLDDAAEQADAVLATPAIDAVEKAEAHELLARVALNRKDQTRARTEAEAAEAADPNRPVLAFVEGRIALDQAKYDDAVGAFERALSAATAAGRPPLADVRVYAAEALARAQRPDEAEQLLTTELALFPANQRARSALQALYRASGRSREAVALSKR